MGDEFKILPGQVTQLTTHPTLSGAAGWRMRTLPEAEPSGLCCVCGERPATEVVHGCPGAMTWQCRRCILRALVVTARAAADRLPELERQLAEEEGR